MSIRVEHLDFSYGRLPVLRDINANAMAGRVVAVLGPNAAGKSTLLRCIIGAIAPSRGRVFIDDAPVDALSPRELAQRAAYVPQRATVAAAFTVRQVVELGRYALNPSAAQIEHAIEWLELNDIADRPYPNLSVGQQQRVTLARALAQLGARGHLILDEPTSAMDLRHVWSCMKLLREQASRGATVILAMHDLALAASIADDAWLLADGSMAAAGPIEEILTKERLERVFGVGFEWVRDSGGHSRLLPQSQFEVDRTRMKST